VNPTSFITAGTQGVGEISINPADVRGEGGYHQPALVLPITVRLNPQPKEAQIALLSLEARLGIGTTPAARRVGLPDRLDLRPNMPVVSVPWGSPNTGLDLRFELTPALVAGLERDRHSAAGRLQLAVEFRGTLAWVRAYNEVQPGVPSDPVIPFEPRYGMLADTSIFWTSTIGDLVLTVEQSTWVDRVLPGVGHDRIRLIEVRLPDDLDPHARVAFGRQLSHLDRAGYHDSVAASRDLLHAWEKRLTATAKHPVSDVVGDAQGWPAEDPRRKLLDELWAAAKNFANAAHHPAGLADPLQLAEPEARAHLLVTAALSEWLAAAVRP
jgi:hypothetical protein